MKGFRVGGANVSQKHANLFINSGSSTSRDTLELIHIVKEKVKQRRSIRILGYNSVKTLDILALVINQHDKRIGSKGNNFPVLLRCCGGETGGAVNGSSSVA